MAVCEDLCKKVLALPMHPYIDGQTQNRIAAALKEGVKQGAPSGGA